MNRLRLQLLGRRLRQQLQARGLHWSKLSVSNRRIVLADPDGSVFDACNTVLVGDQLCIRLACCTAYAEFRDVERAADYVVSHRCDGLKHLGITRKVAS